MTRRGAAAPPPSSPCPGACPGVSPAGRQVAVVGAGIGGLMTALAVARHGFRVTLYERDPAPPDVVPADSMRWLRRGVPQSLHPHFFMGRLRREVGQELLERWIATEKRLRGRAPERGLEFLKDKLAGLVEGADGIARDV